MKFNQLNRFAEVKCLEWRIKTGLDSFVASLAHTSSCQQSRAIKRRLIISIMVSGVVQNGERKFNARTRSRTKQGTQSWRREFCISNWRRFYADGFMNILRRPFYHPQFMLQCCHTISWFTVLHRQWDSTEIASLSSLFCLSFIHVPTPRTSRQSISTTYLTETNRRSEEIVFTSGWIIARKSACETSEKKCRNL